MQSKSLPPCARDEKKARRILLIFLLITIFEGTLRKWIIPQAGSIIYFIKDPLVIYLIIIAIKNKWLAKGVLYMHFLAACTAIFLSFSFSSLANPEYFPIYLYGIRNYILYIPIIFVMAKILNKRDTIYYLRMIIWLSIPIGILALFQYNSPPSSFINKGLSDEGFVFLIADGVVRPYGTFTFTYAHVLFVAACVAAWFVFVLDKEVRSSILKKDGFFILAAMPFTLLMFFTTGSRSIYAYTLVIFTYATLSAIAARSKSGVTGLFIAAALSGVSFMIFMNTEAFELLAQRNQSAIDTEGSPITRALSGLILFTSHFETTPLWGHGIGMGTNAASAILSGGRNYDTGFLLAEDEWSRIFLELGFVVGLIFVLLRINLALSMLAKGIKSCTRHKSTAGLILAGMISPLIINGSMTMQGSALAIGVFFCGLSFAANNPYHPKAINQ